MFAPVWQLNLIQAAGGTIQATPSAGAYRDGASVELRAIPAAGYEFVSWTGNIEGPANPTAILMKTNSSVSANFARTFQLSVSAVGDGGVIVSPLKERYREGEVVEIDAQPADGYSLTGWTAGGNTGVGLSGTGSPDAVPATIKVVMTSDQTVVAEFAAAGSLRLIGPKLDGQGAFSFEVEGAGPVSVESSDDLQRWGSVTNAETASIEGGTSIRIPAETGAKFFRAVRP